MNEHQRGHPDYDHGSAHDTLRWGESHTFELPVGYNGTIIAPGESNPPPLFSRQMLAAHWRWPLSWNLQLIMVPTLNADEASTFTVTWYFTLGVGQAIASYQVNYTFAPTAGVYSPQIVQQLIPSQDLQLRTSIQCPSGASSANAESFLLGAFIAPQTEPHAMTRMHDHIVSGEKPDDVQWMPPGFNESGMGYRR